MAACVEGDQPLIVVGVGLATVPHIADGNHPMGHQREFQQSESPVALVFLGGEVLQLATEGGLLRELVFAICDEDVGVDHATFALHYALVVALVHIHQVQAEVTRHAA